MTLVDVMNTVEQFCGTWGGGHLSCDVADKLTCIEVEALAELFDALGDKESAQQWIRDHSWGDDCGDRHCRCVDCTPHEHTYAQNPHYCDICHQEPEAQQVSASSGGESECEATLAGQVTAKIHETS